ncbi:MAG: hypothetical protein AAF726_03325 [Planctomycetota bacterium]
MLLRAGPIAALLLVASAYPPASAADERQSGQATAERVRDLQDLLDLDDPDLRPYPSEGDAGRRSAIARALSWLASKQSPSEGSIEVGDAEPDQRAPLAVTSLATLAWISGGSTLTRGEYQGNIRRAVDYLLACTHRSADEHVGYIEDRGDPISRTHGHGLATLALAQAYTVSPSTPVGRRIGETLELAVRRIETSQGGEGGWYYAPTRSIEHEGSVTVALVQALRAANDVGIRVDPDGVASAVDYVKRLQVMRAEEAEASAKADAEDAATSTDRQRARQVLGGFRYGLNDPKTSVALTAAGLATLQAAGVYTGAQIDEGYDYIWRQLAIRGEDGSTEASPFPFYERFYLSQALWHHRDTRHYRRWAEPIMRDIVATQSESGSWPDVRITPSGRTLVNRFGSAYATACNVLFLALPDDTLPIFHR